MKKQSASLIAKLLNQNSQPLPQGVHNGHPAELIVMRNVQDLMPNPKNEAYRTDNIDELAAMIDLTQRIEPLIVKPLPEEEGKYMILSGHRRRLAQMYRLEHGMTDDPRVPTITREIVNPLEEIIDDDEMETLNIVFPNKGSRRNLSPVEEAAEIALVKPIIRKIYEHQKEHGETAGKFRTFFANILGISETTLARKEAIGKLSDTAKEAVEEGRITATAAAELSKLEKDEQDTALTAIKEKGERPTVEAVQRVKAGQEKQGQTGHETGQTGQKTGQAEIPIERVLEAQGQDRLPFIHGDESSEKENTASAPPAEEEERPAVHAVLNSEKWLNPEQWLRGELFYLDRTVQNHINDCKEANNAMGVEQWKLRQAAIQMIFKHLKDCLK